MELEPRFAELAQTDGDLDAIRGDGRFPPPPSGSSLYASPGSRTPPASAAERGHEVVLRPRHEQHRRVLRPGERRDEELEPDRQREGLVSELAAEGDELLGPGVARRSRRRG